MASEYTEKITPQRMHEVYRYLYIQAKKAGTISDWWFGRVPSPTWEEASEQEKAMYSAMARQAEMELNGYSRWGAYDE